MNIIQYLTVGIHTCFRIKNLRNKNPCLPSEMYLSLSLRGVNLGNLYLIKSPRGQRSKISIKCASTCKIFEYFRIFCVSFWIFSLSFRMFLNVFERFWIFSNTHFNIPARLIENRAHSVPKFTICEENLHFWLKFWAFLKSPRNHYNTFAVKDL